MMWGVKEKSHERLGRLMNERRLDLTLKWQQIAQRAGITVTTLGAVRKGRNAPTADTKHGLERALQWASGSVDAILAGGDPTLLDLPEGEREPTISDLYALAMRINADLNAVKRQLGMDASGEAGGPVARDGTG